MYHLQKSIEHHNGRHMYNRFFLAFVIQSARMHLFHDERLPSFFRRLAWSPDGSFLLVPAGIQTLLSFQSSL